MLGRERRGRNELAALGRNVAANQNAPEEQKRRDEAEPPFHAPLTGASDGSLFEMASSRTRTVVSAAVSITTSTALSMSAEPPAADALVVDDCRTARDEPAREQP